MCKPPSGPSGVAVLRVVLDTNQFVSGLISARGASAQVLQAWRDHAYLLVISRTIQRDIERVLAYPKLRTKYRLDPKDTSALMELIEREAVVVANPPRLNVIADDPDDNDVLGVAVAAGADYLVSGDHHLLDLRRYRDIAIVTAREFLTMLNR